MDGFAVKASDTLGAGSSSPIVFKLGQHIEKGVCLRVHTGSPVPQGADAVVMLEDTVSYNGNVEIYTQIHPLKNVGEIGEDIRRGDVILRKGQRLRPCDIAVLASLGINNVKVVRKPLVAIIPTGEELVPRGKREPKEGEVYETNGLMASLYARKWGGIPRLLDIVTDDPEKIKKCNSFKPRCGYNHNQRRDLCGEKGLCARSGRLYGGSSCPRRRYKSG